MTRAIGISFVGLATSLSVTAPLVPRAACAAELPAFAGAGIERGRWRLGPPVALDHVLLFVSHVLIRHREAEAPSRPSIPGTGVAWGRHPPARAPRHEGWPSRSPPRPGAIQRGSRTWPRAIPRTRRHAIGAVRSWL